jgi:hypothetical protein
MMKKIKCTVFHSEDGHIPEEFRKFVRTVAFLRANYISAVVRKRLATFAEVGVQPAVVARTQKRLGVTIYSRMMTNGPSGCPFDHAVLVA